MGVATMYRAGPDTDLRGGDFGLVSELGGIEVFSHFLEQVFLEPLEHSRLELAHALARDVEMLADWGAADSLCEALWTAAETAPNTTLAVSLTAVTGAVFTFNVLPVFPSVGGTSPDAQTVSLSFTVVGTPTESFT